MKSFLIIQTAFIGDVILATPVAEKLRLFFPSARIDFLVRKGNENLLANNPCVDNVISWNKKTNKYKNLFKSIGLIRKAKYDYVINIQRFYATGLITALSGAKYKIGFSNNPFSFLYTKKIKHLINTGLHETQRNLSLIENITDKRFIKPQLYPSKEDNSIISVYKKNKYICIAPASVWFTKQYPQDKWIELIDLLKEKYTIYLLGGKEDVLFCETIAKRFFTYDIKNLAGSLSFLQTASLMKDAVMNYVNDSAPLHIASAMNAPATAVFCSTVPAFGFGPLSDISFMAETLEKLKCRPCGLHGFKKCPKKHFNCAFSIKTETLINNLPV